MSEEPVEWPAAQKVLVILAHPDDPEFFCGATLVRWARAGHEIHYLILTGGEKGGPANALANEIRSCRHSEQQNAAAVIGIKSVHFLDLVDGELLPDLDLRREIVSAIRKYSPDVVVTCDPALLYTSTGRINHPDHRAAGQAVLDAIFPAAGNAHYFPELTTEKGLVPHSPRELWISNAERPNVIFDVTDLWEVKLRALKEHKSQIGDPVRFEQRMRSRHSENSTDENPKYEEIFRFVKFI